MTTKGKCKHGEFNLLDGCKLCIAERQEKYQPVTTDMPHAAVEQAFTPPEPQSIVLALRPGEDAEVQKYHNQALELLKWAERLAITTSDDNKEAINDLSLIAKLKKAMEAKKKEYLDPLKAQAEAIRETYNVLMDPVIAADRITREKMGAFDKEQRRIRAEQEKINALRLEAAQKDAALHNGEISEPVNLVEVTQKPMKTTNADMGSAGMTDSWKYEVIDFSLVPDTYKVIDGPLLTSTAKKYHDSKPVPGIRFYCEQIVSLRRR